MKQCKLLTILLLLLLLVPCLVAANDSLEILLSETEILCKSLSENSKNIGDFLTKESRELEKEKQALLAEQKEKGSETSDDVKNAAELLDEQIRLSNSRKLFQESRLEKLEEERTELLKVKDGLAQDQLFYKDPAVSEKLAQLIQHSETVIAQNKILEGKLSIAQSDLTVKKEELQQFQTKLDNLTLEYQNSLEKLQSTANSTAASTEVKLQKFQKEKNTILAKVAEFLQERVELLTRLQRGMATRLAINQKRATTLNEFIEKLDQKIVQNTRDEIQEKRLNVDHNSGRLQRDQRKLEFSERSIERQLQTVKAEISKKEELAKHTKNDFLLSLYRVVPALNLELIKKRKEIVNLRRENIDLRQAADQAVQKWESLLLQLNRKELQPDEIAKQTEKARQSKAKYQEVRKIAVEKADLQEAEIENLATEITDTINLVESIETGDYFVGDTKEVLALLIRKQELLDVKQSIFEETGTLMITRSNLFGKRIRAAELFLTEIEKTGVIIIFGNRLEQYFYFLLALIANFLLAILLNRFLFRWIISNTAKTRFKADYIVAKVVSKPLIIAIMIIGLYFSLDILTIPAKSHATLLLFIRGLFILDIAFLLMRGTEIAVHFINPLVEKTESKLDDQLLPIIVRLVKFFIFTIGIIMFIESFGYPATSILTGLGIGGLAFALAAKDTLANLFGSMMIFSDKIFQIGDWVKFEDNEGIIEVVGLRSTTLRKFDNTVIIVPNSRIANANITNISRFEKRRIYYVLGLTYDTDADGMEKAVNIIRRVLNDHPRIENDHYIFFTDFGAHSLDIMLYFFAKTTVWREYLDIRQEVNLIIMRELKKEGLDIAFPTQTINFSEETLLSFENRGMPPALADVKGVN